VVWLSRFTTRFGSLESYEKGRVEVIDDEPHHYAFSNVFETAARSRPYEKVAVGKNRQYVLEAIRAEGTSDWRTCPHDEFALVMDGEIVIQLAKIGDDQAPDPASEGSVTLGGEPGGPPMGEITARRGHMTLLPHGAAYRFHAAAPGVILMQTIEGPDTVYKWAEIVQTTP
jgi:hypothetical protein